MRRQVFLNETDYVQLYADESSGLNDNNCAVGCAECNLGVGEEEIGLVIYH